MVRRGKSHVAYWHHHRSVIGRITHRSFRFSLCHVIPRRSYIRRGICISAPNKTNKTETTRRRTISFSKGRTSEQYHVISACSDEDEPPVPFRPLRPRLSEWFVI